MILAVAESAAPDQVGGRLCAGARQRLFGRGLVGVGWLWGEDREFAPGIWYWVTREGQDAGRGRKVGILGVRSGIVYRRPSIC